MRRHRAHDAHQAPTFGRSLERGLQLVVGLVIIARTVASGIEIAARSDRTATVDWLAAVVVVGAAAAAALCLSGRAGLPAVGLATVALVAGCLLPHDPVPGPASPGSPVLHLAAPMLLAVLAQRSPLLLIAALDVLYAALRWATGGHDGLLYGVQEVVVVTGIAAAGLALVTQLRVASRRAEAALRNHPRREVHSRAEVEATSALHDDVIPALIALSVGEATQATQTAAAAGLAAIGSRPEAPERHAGEQLLTLAQGTGAEVSVAVTGPPVRVPDAVRRALSSAVREALRNVARHSGQLAAEVRLSRTPGEVRITVVDHGIGFDGATGVGLRIAVLERVRAVGGTAQVISAPGAGTTVELGWRARPLTARLLGWTPDDDRLIRLALGPPVGPVTMPILALAAGLVGTAVVGALVDSPQPAAYAGALAVAGIVALLAWAVRRDPLPWWALALTSLTTAAILAFVLPTMSADLGGLESWIIEVAVLPALVVAWLRSIRVTLLVLLPNAIVIGAVAHQDGLAASALPHLLLVEPLSALVVGLIAHVCRRAGRIVEDATTSDGAAARAEAAHEVLGARHAAVVSALTAGARGQPVGTDVVRLARAIRDCLYLPGSAHARLRDALDDLRRGGAQVETTIRQEPPSSDALAGVLRALDGTRTERVTLSTADGRATIVVVPGITGARALPLRASVTRLGWDLAEDHDATIITTPAVTR